MSKFVIAIAMRSANAGLVELLYPPRVRNSRNFGVSLVCSFVLAFSIVLAPTSHASAQSRVRVAVAPFDGAGGEALRRTVIRAMQDDGRVDVTEDRDGAQLVVQGESSGRGNRRTLSLSARDASGRDVGSARTRVAGHGVDAAVRRLLDGALPQVGGAGGGTGASGNGGGANTDTGDGGDEPPPHEHEDEPRPHARAHGDHFGDDPALLTLAGGAAIRSREASVHVAGGMTRAYDASPYMELYLRVETRPLAHEHSYARGLFLWGELGYALGLSSELPDHTAVSTTFLRLGVHAGYLIPVEPWLELGGSFGFGWESYDLGTNSVLPAVDYPYLRPGLRARIRLAGEACVLGLDAGYRALLSRGALSESFGTGGDSFGYDVAASLSGTTDFGLYYGAEAGWAEFHHSFSGTTGTVAQGTSGTDAGYRFVLTLGYALR